jgi:2-oxoglutarate dehydrogenase complex dehydrogenase (E1) component-like enzyme
VEVEALEQFLHRAYLGAKRFSIEGTDMMVPMLDLVVERAAAAGAREVAIGMAHRGRLNVLAHVLGMPYAGHHRQVRGHHAQSAGTGDVKYHLGAEGTYATRTASRSPSCWHRTRATSSSCTPVVEGMTRAKQSDRTTRELRQDRTSWCRSSSTATRRSPARASCPRR